MLLEAGSVTQVDTAFNSISIGHWPFCLLDSDVCMQEWRIHDAKDEDAQRDGKACETHCYR